MAGVGRTAKVRPLRADAELNRTRIMDAARRLFAVRGLDVSMEDIATEAGLGVTTVTRRFRDRDALVEALFNAELATNVASAHAALAEPDAGDGLADFLQGMFRRAATDRGIAQVILSARYGRGGIATHREELTRLIFEIVERAREQGRLREGVQAGDIPILMLMVGSVADFAARINPELWQRYSEVLIDAVVPNVDGAEWPGEALTREQVTAAMSNWQPRRA
jgi:AcrR family transcriptional regulator